MLDDRNSSGNINALPALRWPELLCTNLPPSEIQANYIQNIISETKSRIAQLEGHDTQPQMELESLRRYAGILRPILSHVRQFPAELLSEIFEYCLPETFEKDIIFVIKAPLLLGQICSRWRTIASSTQTLWTYMRFDLRANSLTADVELVKLWLKRSGGRSLWIRLGHLRLKCETIPIPHPVIDQLVSHCDRWEDLDVCLPSSLFRCIEAAKGRALRLKSLTVRHTVYELPVMRPVDTFEISPQLRRLRIDPRQPVLVPWHQLTRFYMVGMDYASSADCVQVLQKCPNLVVCEIRCAWSDGPLPLVAHLRLAHLRSLKIVLSGESGGLLDLLLLPTLCNLQLVYMPNYPDDDLGMVQLVGCIARSGCSLRTLFLDYKYIHLDDDDLMVCLEGMPSLTELLLGRNTSDSLTERSLRRLTHHSLNTSSKPCLVPMLQIFKIDRPSFFPDDAIVEMIRSRWRLDNVVHQDSAQLHVNRLIKVEIGWVGEGHLTTMLATLDCLRQFRDEGMQVDVYNRALYHGEHVRGVTSWL